MHGVMPRPVGGMPGDVATVNARRWQVNNLWRQNNISAGDHLGFVLRKCDPAKNPISKIVLSSSSRSFIEQYTPSSKCWYYLEPTVLTFEHYSEPHLYIGRAQVLPPSPILPVSVSAPLHPPLRFLVHPQGMYSSITSSFGMGKVVWDARASTVGQPIQVSIVASYKHGHAGWARMQTSESIDAQPPSINIAPAIGDSAVDRSQDENVLQVDSGVSKTMEMSTAVQSAPSNVAVEEMSESNTMAMAQTMPDAGLKRFMDPKGKTTSNKKRSKVPPQEV